MLLEKLEGPGGRLIPEMLLGGSRSKGARVFVIDIPGVRTIDSTSASEKFG